MGAICAFDLSSCVHILPHAAGVGLLSSHTVQGVVSQGGCPGEHLEGRGYSLIGMPKDPDTQQREVHIV